MSNIKKSHLNLVNPSDWVVRFQHLFREGGKVLDLAAGSGRHSIYFLQRGYSVVAVDKNPGPLEFLLSCSKARLIVADLEDGSPWPLNGELFDGILVSNYLYRPLCNAILDALAPEGVLIYETFAEGNEVFGSPKNKDYLLRAGELIDLVQNSLHIVSYEHGVISYPPDMKVKQRICAVKNVGTGSNQNTTQTPHLLFPVRK